MDLIASGLDKMSHFCERGNYASRLQKNREFIRLLKTYRGSVSCMCSTRTHVPGLYNVNYIYNSMVWARERTIPTERPPLVGEVIANFSG
jgi:hypothetical protein